MIQKYIAEKKCILMCNAGNVCVKERDYAFFFFSLLASLNRERLTIVRGDCKIEHI